MNTFTLGILQSFGSHVDIFLYGTCQGADGRPGHSLRNFNHRIKIARTGDREPSLYDIHAQGFQLSGHLNLLYGIQLATGNLLAVAKRSVENK